MMISGINDLRENEIYYRTALTRGLTDRLTMTFDLELYDLDLQSQASCGNGTCKSHREG